MTTGVGWEIASGGSTYVFGPFRVQSEIAMPELRSGGTAGLLPVAIELGVVPAELPGLKRYDEFCAVSRTQYLLDIPGVARYLVENGMSVRIELAPEAPASDVRAYLLGSVFGALCHQNGFLPLHASSVRGATGVTAFLGDSGAGKSTTAAFLKQRGYQIVSDDICLLEPGADGYGVVPVAGWLKLWRESYDNLGETPDDATRIFADLDKFRRYLEPVAGGDLRLRNIVFVVEAAPDEQPLLERVGAAAAITGVMQQTYLSYVVELMGTETDLFSRAAQALAGTERWRLRVPRNWDKLPAVLDLVERELLRG